MRAMQERKAETREKKEKYHESAGIFYILRQQGVS